MAGCHRRDRASIRMAPAARPPTAFIAYIGHSGSASCHWRAPHRVSSAWIRSAANTCADTSDSGISVAPRRRQSASVWRYRVDASLHICPLPLSGKCAGTGYRTGPELRPARPRAIGCEGASSLRERPRTCGMITSTSCWSPSTAPSRTPHLGYVLTSSLNTPPTGAG